MTTDATRRTLMKNLTLGAGATLLAPALTRAAAHAAGDAKAAAPLRVVFVTQSNGMAPAHICPKGWKVEASGGPPANTKTEVVSLHDRELHAALAPLAPHKDRLTLVRGLSGRVAVSDHSANHGALGCYSARRGAVDQTIDAAAADALPGLFKHVLLGATNKFKAMNYALSAAGPGKANPIVCDPDLAYKAIFGTAAGGNARAAFDRRTKLLDFMADDVRRSRAALAAPEREKFDQYVAAFETMHARQAEILAREDAVKKAAPKLGGKAASDLMSTTLEAQFEIAAAALGAGLTNVVTLSSGGGGQAFGSFPEFGIVDLHGIGHGAKYDRPSSEDCFVELRQFHTKLIAGLVDSLSAVKEGGGTAMDNTLIVYLSDSGEGHHPRLEEWPVVLVGDLGGRLKKPGRFVQLPGYKKSDGHRTMAGLYLTILDAVGKSRKAFGTPDPVLRDVDQTARLPELLA